MFGMIIISPDMSDEPVFCIENPYVFTKRQLLFEVEDFICSEFVWENR